MSEIITEEIPDSLAGERLDRIVSLMAEISRADATTTIANGAVELDGVVAPTGKVRLKVGQIVAVDISKIPQPVLPGPDPTVVVDVVYSDEHIIVVNKSAGVVVHPGAGNNDHTLVNGLLARFPEIAGVGEEHRPGIVHRLDIGTTGLLIVARTQEAYEELVAMMSLREVKRHYTALVWGHPSAPVGTIDAPIGRDPRNPLCMAVVASGKPARTNYEVLETMSDPDVSLVACELETGRTHQIRVHLQATGHSVVGDPQYGGARMPLVIGRPFLHAGRLVFDHPLTGEPLEFTSELPADLQEVLERCRGEQ
jgi:23S rRNA pseudouridine1911/1915/1917 synthase